MARARKTQAKSHDRGWGEGTVREVRPGVWRAWRARTRGADGGRSRPSKTFEGRNAEARAAMWARGDVEPEVMLLGIWLDRWLALTRPTIAPNTYSLYRRNVAACAPLAARPIADLTVHDWQALTNDLLERWSRSHMAAWRGCLSTALRAAIPQYLSENPMRRIKLPKAGDTPPKAWRQDEVDRLLAASEGRVHEAWLLFSLGTGVRLGEARALRWEDIDLAAATATISASLDNAKNTRGPTKTRKTRVIDIPDDVLPVLKAQRMRQKPGEQLVFGHDGRAYAASTYRSWLKFRCRDAGIRVLPPHSLRHTCASLAFDAGVPVQDIARQLGHTVEMCQRVYAHYIGQGLRRVANAMGAALRRRFLRVIRANGTENGTRDGHLPDTEPPSLADRGNNSLSENGPTGSDPIEGV